jgi:hypothetical protein
MPPAWPPRLHCMRAAPAAARAGATAAAAATPQRHCSRWAVAPAAAYTTGGACLASPAASAGSTGRMRGRQRSAPVPAPVRASGSGSLEAPRAGPGAEQEAAAAGGGGTLSGDGGSSAEAWHGGAPGAGEAGVDEAAAADEFPTLRLELPPPTNVRIKNAEFVKSSVEVAACPKEGPPEFAIIGRSNVGKSSLINMLTGRKSLAQVSKEPGAIQAGGTRRSTGQGMHCGPCSGVHVCGVKRAAE